MAPSRESAVVALACRGEVDELRWADRARAGLRKLAEEVSFGNTRAEGLGGSGGGLSWESDDLSGDGIACESSFWLLVSPILQISSSILKYCEVLLPVQQTVAK